MRTLLIVGNGMATGRLLDDLHKRQAVDLKIIVIGDEPVGNYNRIMLSPVLAGEVAAQSIVSKPQQWYSERGIEFFCGVRVEEINRRKKTVLTDAGHSLSYDILVLATGSRPARIPAANQALSGVTAFRTLADVARIQELISRCTAHAGGQAVVVGGGFLGLEAAYGIACQGLKVTLVHRSAWLLNRQLDKSAAAYLQKIMACKNIDFRLADEIETFIGEGEVSAAKLKSGEVLPCQLAVIATGITPNRELAAQAGLAVNRGVVVDAQLRSSDADVFALGECVEFEGETFGLVEPIWQQSRVLAAVIAQNSEDASFANLAIATKLKVSGVQMFSAGQHLSDPQLREIVYEDPAQCVYRKLLLQQGRIVGVVLFGDTRGGQDYVELMLAGVDVSASAETLIFEAPKAAAA